MLCSLVPTDMPDSVARVRGYNRVVFPSYTDAASNTRKALNPVFSTKPSFFQQDLYISYFSKFFPEKLLFAPETHRQSLCNTQLPKSWAERNSSGESPVIGRKVWQEIKPGHSWLGSASRTELNYTTRFLGEKRLWGEKKKWVDKERHRRREKILTLRGEKEKRALTRARTHPVALHYTVWVTWTSQ